MKDCLYILFGLIIIILSSCQKKEESEYELKDELIHNMDFDYLPEKFYGNKDIYELASGLIKIEKLDKSEDLTKWEDEITNIIEDNKRLKKLTFHQKDILINDLTDSIAKYGTGCNASRSEIAYLNYGWNLYKSFYKAESFINNLSSYNLKKLFSEENSSWESLGSNISTLIKYKIEENTGTASAYEVPVKLTEIVKERQNSFNEIYKFLSCSKNSKIKCPETNKTVILLIDRIEEINTTHFDYDIASYVEDEDIANVKRSTLQKLNNWLEKRKEIENYIANSEIYNYHTNKLLVSFLKGL